jgi:aspartyl/asparaginyl-tRNA synthetase
MLGPYTANKDGTISYRGNNLFGSVRDISSKTVFVSEIEDRVDSLKKDNMWGHLARINHRINIAVNNYFDKREALFTALPLTTRMISSPGALYGKESISYTSDTCPITLRWFDLPKEAFLSESSQIYLELALTQQGVDQVYSIYNSFRKERADATHLSEFHHIEYEGHKTQLENEAIALGLVGYIISELLAKNEENLAHFLLRNRLNELSLMASRIQRIPKITYKSAQEALCEETKNPKYLRFTMQDCFGPWEEVRLTEIFGDILAIRQFPLLEVPFYHAQVDGVEHPVDINNPSGKKSAVADNTDIIWPGYRETIGSGHRVRSKQELEEKAKIFQLPSEDYEPYLQTRKCDGYVESSGFGLGWERLLQGLLEMPFIWTVTPFPRVDVTLKP